MSHSETHEEARGQPPDDPVLPGIDPVKQVAGGVPAVVHALQHVVGKAGLVRGGRMLLRLNQFEGFDCPGCAWPHPDPDRSAVAEFCENGAKAVAEEGTTARVGPEFFAAHT